MRHERRGWVITEEGKSHRLPDPVLDQDYTLWPLGMPQMKPGEPVKYFSEEDFYWRHEIVEGEAYVYLKKPRTLKDVPPEEIDKLLSSG
jgi:hypothetical protein